MSLSSAAHDLLTTLMISSSFLWEMMLWLSVPVILKNKAALDTQKGTSLDLKCVRMRLAAGLRPDPLGKLERPPRPSSRNWGRVPTSKGKGREWEKERKGMTKGKGGRVGEGGKGGPPSRIAKAQRWQP